MDSNGNVPGGRSNSRQESTNANSTNPTEGSLFGNLVANLANLSTVQPQSYNGLVTVMSVLTGQTFQVVTNLSTSGEIHQSNINITNDQILTLTNTNAGNSNHTHTNVSRAGEIHSSSILNITNDQIQANTNAGNSNHTHTNMSRAGTDTNVSRAGTDIEQAQTITNVNVPTLPAMDLHQWEEGAEEQHPWNYDNQNKSLSLKECNNDQTFEEKEDPVLTESFVDINNPETIDLRLYPDGLEEYYSTKEDDDTETRKQDKGKEATANKGKESTVKKGTKSSTSQTGISIKQVSSRDKQPNCQYCCQDIARGEWHTVNICENQSNCGNQIWKRQIHYMICVVFIR
jgi:hypothetical protein